MQDRSRPLLGIFLVLLGFGFLVANLLHISFWSICFPTTLIVIGALLLIRPKVFGASSASSWYLFGDVKREGEWAAADEELWLLVGDARLDFTRAQVPVGETRIHINGFIGDVDVIAPADIGILISASGVFVDVRTPADKIDRFLSPVNSASSNYATAERKVHLITTFLIGDIDMLQR